jgi:hypothetical protein
MAIKYSDLNLGQIEALVNKCGGMEGVQRLLSGTAKVVIEKHVVDLNADPFVPDGWKVEEHQKSGNGSGTLEWDAEKVEFYLDDGQQGDKYVEGNKLRKRLAVKPVLNANVLDYLLKNPDLIPESWKKDEQGNTRYIFFWGTIYRRDSDGGLCVRYLFWGDGRWHWSTHWLGSVWDGSRPAALRAS